MRRIWISGILVAAAIGAGFLFLTERPLAVTVVQPERDVALRIYGLGTVEARILSRVGFEVSAALTALAADAGDSVASGQELAVLHSAEQEARVARARAALAANEANTARADAAIMRARSTLAQRDEDVARADLAVAEADLAVVRAQALDAAAALRQEEAILARHRLIAPYDAVVVARHAELGMVVKAGDAAVTLIDPATIWIQAYVDEERAGQLALGQPGTVRLRSQPAAEFHGAIARIGLESDRVNEERRVWLTCADCPAEMFLGEQAEVRILTGTRASALMVPEVAIAGFDGHRGTVWTVRDGRLARAELTFGARDDRGRVEVAGGLPEGAAIVARPPNGAAEGRRARVSEAP